MRLKLERKNNLAEINTESLENLWGQSESLYMAFLYTIFTLATFQN